MFWKKKEYKYYVTYTSISNKKTFIGGVVMSVTGKGVYKETLKAWERWILNENKKDNISMTVIQNFVRIHTGKAIVVNEFEMPKTKPKKKKEK